MRVTSSGLATCASNPSTFKLPEKSLVQRVTLLPSSFLSRSLEKAFVPSPRSRYKSINLKICVAKKKRNMFDDSCCQRLSRIGFSTHTPTELHTQTANFNLKRRGRELSNPRWKMPLVNVYTKGSPHEFVRVCRGGARTRERDLYKAEG